MVEPDQIQAAPLIEAYKELNGRYTDMVNALSLLRALSILDVSDGSEEQVIAGALQALVLNHDLERCSLFLLRDGLLENAGGLDWPDLIGMRPDPRRECRRFRLGEGLVGIAAQTGELQHSRNCLLDPRFALDGAPASGAVGSLIAVPVKAHGETLGVLNVSHPHTGFFTVAHERALTVFANFLGQMILTRRLLTDMDRRVVERTAQLQQALDEAVVLKRRYAEMSTLDELTGLHNRRHFFPAARTALARSLRGNTPFSLVVMDVDHFKQINDTFGHTGGDQVLSQLAALLRGECREADLLARFGGEEFIIALPDTDATGARLMAERIRSAVKAWRGSADGRALHMTVSLGISCLAAGAPQREVEQVLEQLISEADQALYFGKHNGRDQYRFYQEIACFL